MGLGSSTNDFRVQGGEGKGVGWQESDVGSKVTKKIMTLLTSYVDGPQLKNVGQINVLARNVALEQICELFVRIVNVNLLTKIC